MIRAIFLTLCIIGISSEELPCRKLYFFGNSIENKAVLSPVIIVGQRGMEIPFNNGQNKAAIEIKKILKGSLGDWKKNILIAGHFYSNNDSSNLCQFYSNDEERIYFLDIASAENGEYKVLFNPEISNYENIEIINKTICNNCATLPKLHIKEQTATENSIYLDCTTDSKPHSILKWNHPGDSNIDVTPLRNGIRLNIKSAKSVTNVMYICSGTNILGETTASIVIKANRGKTFKEITRCASNDKLLCNGHGKCYNDKIDGGMMFCRCDSGFIGARCSENQIKLSANYLKRKFNIDETYCKKNGYGYENVISRKQFCICKEDFFGQDCANRISQQSKTKISPNPMQRSNSADLSEKDKLELKKIVNDASSKIAIKYMLIGGALILCGFLLISFVVIIMWKCFRHSSSRKNRRTNVDDTKNGYNSKPIAQFKDELVLLPGNTEMSKVPMNSKQNLQYNESQKLKSNNQFCENNFYEGVNAPSSQNSSIMRQIAL